MLAETAEVRTNLPTLGPIHFCTPSRCDRRPNDIGRVAGYEIVGFKALATHRSPTIHNRKSFPNSDLHGHFVPEQLRHDVCARASRGPMRLKHRSIAFLGLLALLSFLPSIAEAQTLLWDPSPSADVIGYRVWSGQQRGVYNRQVDVGKVTSHKPTGMDWTKTQFFAIQAYNAAGLNSARTPEVEWVPSITRLVSLTSNAGNPLLMGRPVTWTAVGSNNLGPVHYQFWLFGRTGWSIVQPYGSSNKFTWTPGWDDQGSHYLQVWARAANSAAASEAVLGTNAFSVYSEPMTLKADTDFPTPPDNPVSWTATVAGAGVTPLDTNFGCSIRHQGGHRSATGAPRIKLSGRRKTRVRMRSRRGPAGSEAPPPTTYGSGSPI